MPLRWRVDDDTRRVEVVAEETISAAEIRDYLERVVEAGAMPYAKLFDASTATVDMATDELKAIGAWVRQFAREGRGPVGPLTEHSFHGIDTSRPLPESVTHVSGTFCHRCLGSLNPSAAQSWEHRRGPVPVDRSPTSETGRLYLLAWMKPSLPQVAETCAHRQHPNAPPATEPSHGSIGR